MDTRKLGRSGLHVSPLCLGTMMFGAATDEKDSASIIAAARDSARRRTNRVAARVQQDVVEVATAGGDAVRDDPISELIAGDHRRWVAYWLSANPLDGVREPRGLIGWRRDTGTSAARGRGNGETQQ